MQELAVIRQSQEVEVAKKHAMREEIEKEKEANLSKIEKNKELAIAKANYDIQRANAEASIFNARYLHILFPPVFPVFPVFPLLSLTFL